MDSKRTSALLQNFHRESSEVIMLAKSSKFQTFYFLSGIFMKMFKAFSDKHHFCKYYKISCFCTDGKISVRINLPLFSTVVPAIIFVFILYLCLAGTTVENKGKLIISVHHTSYLKLITSFYVL